MTALAPVLEQYFTAHLLKALNASSHTIGAYRDTWRILIGYTVETSGIRPDRLLLEQFNSEHIAMFLNHLEHERGNSISTRNARLAAIHSFFSYASHRYPEHANLFARVLAIPVKRRHNSDVTYLSEAETKALLAAPDPRTWTGQRDLALLTTGISTGMRVAELTALTWHDIHLGAGAHASCHGKGRRDRATPLDTKTVTLLRNWKRGQQSLNTDPVFPTRTGNHMSTDAVAQRLSLHANAAAKQCPTLTRKRVTPHTLRHTTAMRMLQAGIDTTVIALWLGHASAETTMIYLHADMKIKETALARTQPVTIKTPRYKPQPALLAFLESL